MTLPLLAVALLATACGGSTKAATSAPTTTTPAGSAGASALAKYTSCLESHGVPASVASSTFGFGRRRGGSTSSTTTGGTSASTTRPTIPSQYQAAYTTCRSTLPTGGFGGRGNFNSAQLQAYRNCLTIHGVTVPTTAAGSQGPGFGGGFGGASSSPAFKAAQQACANLLPARPTGSTPTSPAA